MRKQYIVIIIIILSVATLSFFGTITRIFTIGGTCDFAGGWGRGTSSSCSCFGKKITVDNSLAVDGNYQTMCVGVGIYKHNRK